jgi:hypothetical protein
MRVMKKPDALFIFTLVSHYTSTCFGLASGPVLVDSRWAHRQLTKTYIMYQLSPPDDGLLASLKHVEV